MKRATRLTVVVALWSGSVAAGTLWLWRYKNLPGASSEASNHWPVQSAIPAPHARPTLVMVAHPKCPCTTASLTELANLLRELGSDVDAHVLFVVPKQAASDFEKSELVAKARAIDGLKVHLDRSGEAANAFGSKTSGDVFLYAATGQTLFHGGITSARGHVGPSVGQARVKALVRRQPTDHDEASVYGCSLQSPQPIAGRSP
jgi:hypothetical protein